MTPSGNNGINTHGLMAKSRKRRRSKIDVSELLTRRDSRHSLLSSILDLTASMLETSGTNLDQGNTYVINISQLGIDNIEYGIFAHNTLLPFSYKF